MATEKVIREIGVFNLSFNHLYDSDGIFLVAVSRETRQMGLNLYFFKELPEGQYRAEIFSELSPPPQSPAPEF